MSNYPQSVQDFVTKMSTVLDEEFSEEFGKEEFEKHVGTFALQKFLDGDEITFQKFINGIEPMFDEEEMANIIRLTITETIFNSLKRKGFVDSIENEDKDVFFLTQKGKAANLILSNISKNKELW